MSDAVIKLTVDGGQLAADTIGKINDALKGITISVTEARPKLDAMAAGMAAAGKAATDSAKLIAGMSQAGRDAAESVKSAGSSFMDFGKGFGEHLKGAIEDPLSSLKTAVGGVLESLGPAAVGIGAIGGAALAAGLALFEMAARAAAVGGTLNDMGEKTGISVPKLSRLSAAAQVAGTDINSLAGLIQKMDAAAADSPDKFAKGLERIGLNFQDFVAMAPEDRLMAISSALGATADSAARNAAGTELMGKGFREVAPSLMKLNEALEVTSGLTVWTDQQAKDAEQFEMQTKALGLQASDLGVRIGRDLIPPALALLQWFRDVEPYAATAIKWASSAGLMFQALGTVSGYTVAGLDLVRGSLNKLPDPLGDTAKKAKELKDQLLDAAHTPAIELANLLKPIQGLTVSAGDLELAWKEETRANADSVEQNKKAAAAAEAWRKVLDDVNSAGISWQTTLESIDGSIVDNAESLLRAGVSAQNVAKYYGLTEAQVKSLEAANKAYDESLKVYATTLEKITQLEGGRGATLEQLGKIGFPSPDPKVAREWSDAYDNNARIAIAAEMRAGDAVSKEFADTVSYKIQKIRELQDYEEGELDWSVAGAADAYARIKQAADAQVGAIVRANDPIVQAWRSMNTDMRGQWASTWEQALNGSISFGKAFVKTLEDALVAPFQRMLAAMLASWEQQLLGPMIGDAKGAMGAVGGIFSASGRAGASGGSSGGVNVGGVLGHSGVGGANAPPGMVSGSTGSFDAAGNWVPTAVGVTGKALAGAGLIGGVTGALAIANGASTGSALGQVGLAAGMTAATTAITTGSIAATAAIGAMTFGVGAAAIGVALLIKHFMGVSDAEKAARASFGEFEGQFKNLDGSAMNLSQTIDSIGQAYDYVGKSGTEAQADIKKALDATHQSAAAEKAALEPINAVLQQAADKAKAVDTGFGAIMTAAQAAGGHIPASLQPAIAKLLEMKGLTDDQKKALQALGPAAAPTFDELTSTASKYGITLAGLGGKFEQANIEGRAKGIFDDFSALTSAGADVGGVLSGMSDEISGLVDDSMNFGSKIPDNMKPLIQNLIDAGKLTDDQGKKITDISKLSFEDTPVDKAFADLTKAVQDLTGYLTGTGGVTDAIDKVSRAAGGIPDNPYKNWQVPPGPRIGAPDGASTGGWVTGSGIQHFSAGGWANGTDTVRAMLTPGELVLNRSQQTDLAGRLAGGGGATIIVVNGRGKSDDEIHTEVLRRLPDSVLHNVEEVKTGLKRALGMPVTTWT